MRQEIDNVIAAIDAVADYMPGVLIIHNIQTNCVEYMSERGRKQLGVSNEELKSLGAKYHERFFNPEDASDYVPKLFDLMERNDRDEILTFFQQVRPNVEFDFSWFFSSIKVILRDQENKPLLCLTIANSIDPHHHLTSKVSRLLEENNFLRNNAHIFQSLTKREREILALTVIGKSSQEIADELFISPTTVDTHRRNMKQKLNAHTTFELSQFARAFDLI